MEEQEKNHSHTGSDKKYTGEYPEIYGEELDVDAIKSRMRKKKFSIQSALVLFFFLIGLTMFDSENNVVAGDYRNGNTLYLPTAYGNAREEQPMGNPWVGGSLISQMLYEPLFITDSSFTQINSRLAENLEISEDGLTYSFTMGENYWSDGTPLTVDDVMFSFHGFMECGYVNSTLSSAFHNIVGAKEYAESFQQEGEPKVSSITGIQAEGNRITIELIAPTSTFGVTLTQFCPLPEHILKDEDMTTITTAHSFFMNNNGVYSGAYMVEGLDEDLNVICVKNPYYTIADLEIESIQFCWDWNNTEFDYFATSNLSQMVSHRSMKGFEEHPVEVYYYRYFIFNLSGGTDGGTDGQDNPAMQDERVRKAILHAIDVETLMNDVYLGKATRFYGGATFLAEEFCEYNPEKARALLEEAGYDFDRPFTIAAYSSDAYTRIFNEKIKEMLEAVGLTVQYIRNGAAALYAGGEFDMMMKNLSAFNVEEWYSEYLSTNTNISSILGTEGHFDELMGQLTSTTDSSEYSEILLELVALEQDLLYKMPMFLLDEAIFINSNRLTVPDDMTFGNTRYICDLRMDEWYIQKMEA